MLSFLLMLRDIFLMFKVLFCLLMMSYITHSMLGDSAEVVFGKDPEGQDSRFSKCARCDYHKSYKGRSYVKLGITNSVFILFQF